MLINVRRMQRITSLHLSSILNSGNIYNMFSKFKSSLVSILGYIELTIYTLIHSLHGYEVAGRLLLLRIHIIMNNEGFITMKHSKALSILLIKE